MKPIFRPSPDHSPIWIIARTLAYAVVLWSLTLWLIPMWIVQAETWLGVPAFRFPFQVPFAVVMFVVSAVFNLSSAYTMATIGKGTPLPLDCAPRLVIRGFYRYVRNPMAIGGLGLGFAVGVSLGSWGVLIYVAAGMAFWNWIVRPIEERDLSERFGADFENYQRQVKCWVPTFSFREDFVE